MGTQSKRTCAPSAKVRWPLFLGKYSKGRRKLFLDAQGLFNKLIPIASPEYGTKLSVSGGLELLCNYQQHSNASPNRHTICAKASVVAMQIQVLQVPKRAIASYLVLPQTLLGAHFSPWVFLMYEAGEVLVCKDCGFQIINSRGRKSLAEFINRETSIRLSHCLQGNPLPKPSTGWGLTKCSEQWYEA